MFLAAGALDEPRELLEWNRRAVNAQDAIDVEALILDKVVIGVTRQRFCTN